MIRYSDTTVFNVGAQTLVNTVNCRGVMGAGVALEFRLRYPAMFGDYAERCRRGEVRLGEPYAYRVCDSLSILNFPTKDHWKEPSRIEWVEAGLERFATLYKEAGITSAAFPPLGCSNGGLEWRRVRPLMERHLGPLKDLEVVICLDREADASGVEGEMVGLLNESDLRAWGEGWELPGEVARAVLGARPFRRFRDLLRVPGVGKETYTALFEALYARATGASPPLGEAETPGGSALTPRESARQLAFDF